MNVDTHAPFTGFDVDKEYDSFRTDDIYETVELPKDGPVSVPQLAFNT